MICDFCKNNIATVHLIRVQNDNVEKVNICLECAKDFSFFSEEDFYKDLNKILFRIFQSDVDRVYEHKSKKILKNLNLSYLLLFLLHFYCLPAS